MSSGGSYEVSVVIPSVGRPELHRAIQSVLDQNFLGHIELIVVFDLDEAALPPEVLALVKNVDQVLFTGGGKRGGFARNLGVQCARGQWIAFLDDDDAWSPDKVRLQMALAIASKGPEQVVYGCRAVQTVTGSSENRRITGVPKRLIGPSEDIATYLFRGRRAGSRRASFFASSVLATRAICLQVPWDEKLKRHQDWDWLVRLSRQPNVSFAQVPEDLVTIYVGTGGSISAGSDWEASLTWSKRALADSDQQTQVDFLAGQPLRYAMQSRQLGGIKAIVSEMIRLRRSPNLGPVLIGVSGLIPRTSLQRLMRVFK